MRNRALNLVFLISLSCSLFGVLIVYVEPDAAAAFAYLVSKIFRDAASSLELKTSIHSSPDSIFSLVGFYRDTIFYGILAFCATVLTVCACFSILTHSRRDRAVHHLGANRDVSGRISGDVLDPRNDGISSAWGMATYLLNRGSADSSSWSKRIGFRDNMMTPTLWRLRALHCGLVGKMIFIFTGAIAVFGIVTVILVYSILLPSLKRQTIERAKIRALNIATIATITASKKKVGMLSQLLRKEASVAGLAYILLEDGTGTVLAHSFYTLPKQIGNPDLPGEFSNETHSTIALGDDLVYDARFPIRVGRAKSVRIGLWKRDTDAELSEIAMPIVNLVALVVIAEIGLAIFLIWRLTRPILRIVRVARRISIGELDVISPGVEDNGEFGELSRALERMRSSVKAAMARL